jgi:hypothetical protein
MTERALARCLRGFVETLGRYRHVDSAEHISVCA